MRVHFTKQIFGSVWIEISVSYGVTPANDKETHTQDIKMKKINGKFDLMYKILYSLIHLVQSLL